MKSKNPTCRSAAALTLALCGALVAPRAQAMPAEQPPATHTAESGGDTPGAGAQTPPRPRIVVLPAGASRAIHQAGMLHGLLGEWPEPQKGGSAYEPGTPEIAFFGASTSSLNALVGAIMWCAERTEATAVAPSGMDWSSRGDSDNPLYRMWSSLSLDALLPGDRTCVGYKDEFDDLTPTCDGESVYAEGDGLATAAGLSGLRTELLAVFNRAGVFRPGCHVRVGFPLTAETAIAVDDTIAGLVTSRRLVVFDLVVHEHGTLQVQPVPQAEKNIPPRLTLPRMAPHHSGLEPDDAGDPANVIDPVYAIDAVMAALTYPILFAPRPLVVCGKNCMPADEPGVPCPQGTHACTDRFVNGGFFDGIPMAVALAAMPKGAKDVWLVGDTDADADEEQAERPTSVGGAFLVDYLGSVVDVARQYEIQMLIRRGELGDLTPHPSCKRKPLVGDLGLGFGAFFHHAFIEHDYFRGVLDGQALAREHCERIEGLEVHFDEADPVVLVARALAGAACGDDRAMGGVEAGSLNALAARLDTCVESRRDARDKGTKDTAWASVERFEAGLFARFQSLARRMAAIDAAAGGPGAAWSAAGYYFERRHLDEIQGVRWSGSGADGALDAGLRLLLPSSVGGEAIGPDTFESDAVNVSDIRLHWDIAALQLPFEGDAWLRFDGFELGLLARRLKDQPTDIWAAWSPALHWRPSIFGNALWSIGVRAPWWIYADESFRGDRIGVEGVLRLAGGHLEVAGGTLDIVAGGAYPRSELWQVTLSISEIERLTGLITELFGGL